MQPVTITINVRSQDIPDLVCCDYSMAGEGRGYAADIARAVAESLGVQDFLSKPGRVAELRRTLWQRDPAF